MYFAVDTEHSLSKQPKNASSAETSARHVPPHRTAIKTFDCIVAHSKWITAL